MPYSGNQITRLGPSAIPRGLGGSFDGKALYVEVRDTSLPAGWLATSQQLAVELKSVSDVGRVYIEDLHIRDPQTLHTLFASPVEGQRDRLKGWRIHRQDIEEMWWTTTRTRSVERYILRGILGVVESGSSEWEWQNTVSRVVAHFRGLKRVARADVMTAAKIPAVEYLTIAGKLCHYTELEISVEEIYTIAPPSSGQPPQRRGSASTRSVYAQVADQIAGYLATIDGTGHVWPFRKFSTTRESFLDSFTVELPSSDRRSVKTWQVYRLSDAETRGLANRIEGAGVWKVQGACQWRDATHTGSAFQQHLDDVRVLFRGLGNMGNVFNPTQSLHEPLQIREIGARMLQGNLVHFADCELPITGVIHA